MKARSAILFALLAAAAAQAAHYAPLMPARMASHFDGAGVPNGFSTPGAFFTIMLGLQAIMALSWLTIRPFMRRLPPEQINLPNRDYWLENPERREVAFERFAAVMLEFGIMLELLLVYVTQLVVEANLRSPVILSSKIALALIALGVGTCLWLVRLFTAFPRGQST